jgi:hypothetical protein
MVIVTKVNWKKNIDDGVIYTILQYVSLLEDQQAGRVMIDDQKTGLFVNVHGCTNALKPWMARKGLNIDAISHPCDRIIPFILNIKSR